MLGIPCGELKAITGILVLACQDGPLTILDLLVQIGPSLEIRVPLERVRALELWRVINGSTAQIFLNRPLILVKSLLLRQYHAIMRHPAKLYAKTNNL